jgi:hypothetical protein
MKWQHLKALFFVDNMHWVGVFEERNCSLSPVPFCPRDISEFS